MILYQYNSLNVYIIGNGKNKLTSDSVLIYILPEHFKAPFIILI